MQGSEVVNGKKPVHLPSIFTNTGEPKKFSVYFTNPTDCQFYFAKNNKTGLSRNISNESGLERNDEALCTDLGEKIAMLETSNAQLLRNLLSLEERIGALENESTETETKRPRKLPAILRRAKADNSGVKSADETLSGNQLRQTVRIGTATQSPATSSGGDRKSCQIVPNSDVGKVNGILGLQYSLTYPGRLSCVCEIANRFDRTPLIEIQRLVANGSLVEKSTPVNFAKSFGISDNGSNKISVAMIYLMGRIRFAFAIYIDDMRSFFRISFAPCAEPNSAVTKDLDEIEWIQEKIGFPQGEKITADYENYRLTGNLTGGKKAYFQLDVVRIGKNC